MIKYTQSRPTEVTNDDLLALYRSVGWSAYLQHPANTLAAFNHSTVLWATEQGHLIGLIRGITDNHTILYIQDILVMPAKQRQQVGTTLVHRFLNQHAAIGQTVLITDPEPRTQAFYASLGFREVLPQDYGRAFVLDRRY